MIENPAPSESPAAGRESGRIRKRKVSGTCGIASHGEKVSRFLLLAMRDASGQLPQNAINENDTRMTRAA
jgi:hypothetical protein